MKTQKASTLAELEAAFSNSELRAEQAKNDPVVFHKSLGVAFQVVPMGGGDYRLWHHMNDLATKDKRDLAAQKRADKFLLLHAVVADGGTLLSDELADKVLDAPRGAVDAMELLEAAAAQNPPRRELPPETLLSYGFSRAMIVLVRVLQDAGLFELLRERQGEESDADLAIWEATIPFWEATLDADEAAREIGIERETGVEVENVG